MKGTIYKCTFADGKVYIGKSILVGRRLKEHIDKTAGPTNPRYYDAYKRLGEPEVEILFQEDFTNIYDREITLCCLEKYYIEFFNSTDPNHGYNVKNISPMTPGTKKAVEKKIKEITQELLDERLIDYHSIKEKLTVFKEPLTPAELYFIKEKFRSKNIFQKSIDNFDFNDYSNNSDEEFEFLLEDALPMIRCVIETDTGEEVQEYVYTNADEVFKNINDNPILRISDLGEIKEYQSLNDICEELKIDRPDNIRYALRGKQKKAYGFIWIYKNDYEDKVNNKEESSLF